MINKTFSRRMIVLISLLIVTIMSLTTVTFGWLLFKSNDINGAEIGGQLLTNYFHTGDGTKEKPFVITRPVHYYNLVNLYQRMPEYSDKHYYFQLGTELKGENNGYWVYNYDEYGKLVEDDKYSQTLNLSCYDKNDPLYPIGTHDKNFLGRFDGKGLTISGFTVAAPENKQWCDIGIFGYIGEGLDVDGNGTIEGEEVAAVNNVYFSNVTIDLRNVTNATSASEIEQGQTHNANVHQVGEKNVAFVGYIAGHVMINTQVRNVFINDVTIRGGNAASSRYGYFGCLEKSNGQLADTLGQSIGTEFGSGDGAGWGGSLDMKNIQKRLQSIWSYTNSHNETQVNTYPSAETVIIDEINNTLTRRFDTYKGITLGTRSSYRFRLFTTQESGQYYFYQAAGNDAQYMLMYGEDILNPKTVTTYVLKNDSKDAWYIYDGNGHYLSSAGGTVSSANSVGSGNDIETSNTKWIFEDGKLYSINDGVKLYLNANGLSAVLSPTGTTVWTKTDTTLYTTVGSTNYYLVYDSISNNWKLTRYLSYFHLTDGNGHYISVNGTTREVQNSNSSSTAARWQVTVQDGGTMFWLEIDNTVFYLNDAYPLSVSTTPTYWSKDSRGYYTDLDGIRSYIVFDGTDWRCEASTGYKISDGSGHYLSVTSNGSSSVGESTATVWQITGGNTVQVYTIAGGRRYYLSNSNGNPSLSESAFNWTKTAENELYCTVNGVDHYLLYDNGWCVSRLDYYKIHSGTNYLSYNGTSFVNSTEANATHFYFANTNGANPSGAVSFDWNGTMQYIRVSNNQLTATTNQGSATSWGNNGSSLTTGGMTLAYIGGQWSVVTSPLRLITDGNGNYMTVTRSGDNYVIGNTTSKENATAFNFSTGSGTNGSGIISTTINGTTVYLRYNRGLTVSTNNNTTWSKNANNFYCTEGFIFTTTYYIVYNGSNWVAQTNRNPSRSIIEQYTPTVQTEHNELESAPISTTEYTSAFPTANESTEIVENITFTETTQRLYTKSVDSGKNGGYQTYFPIKTEMDATTELEVKVSSGNTGYIIGGGRLHESASESQDQKNAGDLRISYFPISNIKGSFDGSTLSNIVTINDSGRVSVDETEIKASATYKNAKKNLEKILKEGDTSHVYGLHFMDARISKDYLVTADRATILSETYENYQMPVDSIDFHVIRPGAISFFAGEYYTNNNAFFSLHEIFRDEDQKITEIKEILEVYEHSTAGVLKKYIYKYSGGSFSSGPEGETFTNEQQVFDAGYKSVFKTAWITNPRNNSMNRNGTDQNDNAWKRLFYFEIPCNPGEYALGSVPGKTGAYLNYLDISSNGGAILDAIVSSNGNDVTNQFQVDVRTPETILASEFNAEAPDEYARTLLQIAVDAPATATDPQNFSVKISYDNSVKRLYTISITNLTDSPIDLTVFICDNDGVRGNEYLYYYRIIYTNKDGTKTYSVGNVSEFQRCTTFTVPSTGNMAEKQLTPK